RATSTDVGGASRLVQSSTRKTSGVLPSRDEDFDVNGDCPCGTKPGVGTCASAPAHHEKRSVLVPASRHHDDRCPRFFRAFPVLMQIFGKLAQNGSGCIG